MFRVHYWNRQKSRRVDLDAGPRRSVDGANRDDQKPDGSSRTGSPDLSEGVDSKIDTMWFGSQHGIIYVYHIPGMICSVEKDFNSIQDQVHEHKKKLVESVFPIRLYP